MKNIKKLFVIFICAMATPNFMQSQYDNIVSIQKSIVVRMRVNLLVRLSRPAEDENNTSLNELHKAVLLKKHNEIANSTMYIDSVSQENMTPLFMAAAIDDEQAVQILLEKGADPTIPDHHQIMPSDITKKNQIKDILKDAEEKFAQRNCYEIESLENEYDQNIDEKSMSSRSYNSLSTLASEIDL